MTSNHTPYWLATIYLPIQPATILLLVEHLQGIENVFTATEKELTTFGIKPMQIQAIKIPPWNLIERDLKWMDQLHQHIITWENPSYPEQLKNIPQPPLVLFVRGNVDVLATKQIAVVGARNASPWGMENAERFAYHLAEAGFSITSGMAKGIDAAAHQGALRAKGKTIGVAGTGLFHFYPASNKTLIERISAEGGAVISEFPLDASPQAYHFPRRNRIISGMSLGVLVVEAALKSGSLGTVRHALEQGREVFALPGSIHHPLARGCHFLIRQGAKLVEKVNDIIEEFSHFHVESTRNSTKIEQKITEKPHSLINYIGYEITSMDMIICRSGLTAGQVSSILSILELHGYIQCVVGGYIRTPK